VVTIFNRAWRHAEGESGRPRGKVKGGVRFAPDPAMKCKTTDFLALGYSPGRKPFSPDFSPDEPVSHAG
jgi:hypothetical protein